MLLFNASPFFEKGTNFLEECLPGIVHVNQGFTKPEEKPFMFQSISLFGFNEQKIIGEKL